MMKWSRGLVLEELGGGLVEKGFPLPQLRMNDVLVRIEVAAINSIDMMYIQGLYPAVKDLPAVPGFEGSGTVIETGSGPLTWGLLHKRVAVLATERSLPGTWAHFTVVPATACYPLRDDISLETGACLFVNPLTVCLFEELMEKGGHTAVVLTAAASAIARMTLRVCQSKGITCVCIVSRESQREQLHHLGAQHVLLTEEFCFCSKLVMLCRELSIRCAFDAVGGQLACQILNNLQPSGVLYAYSAIDSEPTLNEISAHSLIFSKKQVVGVTVLPWWARKSTWQKSALIRRIQSNLHLYGTEVAMEFLLGDVKEAVNYHRKYKSRGKVMFRMRTVYQQEAQPSVELSLAVEPSLSTRVGHTLKEAIGFFRRSEDLPSDSPAIELKTLGSQEGSIDTKVKKRRLSGDFHKFWDPLRLNSAGEAPDYTGSFREDKDDSEEEALPINVKRD